MVRTHKSLRLLLAVALSLTGMSLIPVTALAHASVVASRPAAGDELSTAPGVVGLQFSEPINQRLSRLVVAGPAGNPFPFQVVGPREMQAQVTSTRRGVYAVSWTTVSDVDGHTLRGSFQFGVGVPVARGTSAAGAGDPQAADLLVAVFRALEYLGLFGGVGCFVLAALARRQPALAIGAPDPRWPLLAALLAGVAVVAGESISAAGGFSLTAFGDYLFAGPAGYARLVRIGLEAVALLVASPAAELALLPIVGAMVALAAAGHGAADRPWPLGVLTDALHLVAGAVWAGGLLVITAVSMRTSRDDIALLIRRFSRVALVAFALSVALGALRGTQELAALADLLSTGYGRVLGVKILVVAAVVPVALLVRRLGGRLLRVDAAIAITIVMITAVLAAFPLPPRRAQEADAADLSTGATQAWPHEGDLTMAAGAGHTLVGLTLRPGRPGRNQVLLYLVPPSGEAAAQGLRAGISFAGVPVPLRACGSSCRTGSVDLNGAVSAHVDLLGAGRGSADFAIPNLPVGDATATFQAAQSHVGGATSYADDEVFGPVEPSLHTQYQFEKPDRMHVRASLGSEEVWVGTSIYRRDGPSSAWRIEPTGTPLRVGEFIWDGGTPLNVRKVGESGAGAAHLTEISFFELRDQTPLWFRVWIDDNQTVLRSEMRAQSHFMDDSYSQFGAAFRIAPPV